MQSDDEKPPSCLSSFASVFCGPSPTKKKSPTTSPSSTANHEKSDSKTSSKSGPRIRTQQHKMSGSTRIKCEEEFHFGKARPILYIQAEDVPHFATMFWFHGLGDTSRGWEIPLRQMAEAIPGLRIIAPTAPSIPRRRIFRAKGACCFKCHTHYNTARDVY